MTKKQKKATRKRREARTLALSIQKAVMAHLKHEPVLEALGRLTTEIRSLREQVAVMMEREPAREGTVFHLAPRETQAALGNARGVARRAR